MFPTTTEKIVTTLLERLTRYFGTGLNARSSGVLKFGSGSSVFGRVWIHRELTIRSNKTALQFEISRNQQDGQTNVRLGSNTKKNVCGPTSSAIHVKHGFHPRYCRLMVPPDLEYRGEAELATPVSSAILIL